MCFGNCMLHAAGKSIRHGGYIIMRDSWALRGLVYPHFVHARDLPEDLIVSQLKINDESLSGLNLLFEGHIETLLGDVKPPPVRWGISWSFLFFWLIYLIGMLTVFSKLFSVLGSAFGYMASIIIPF